MRAQRIGQRTPASLSLQARPVQARPVRLAKAPKLPPCRLVRHVCRAESTIGNSGAGYTLPSIPDSFGSAYRISTVMAKGDVGGGGAAVLERSKVSFKQASQQKQGPELDTGGSGGDIGKILRNGGDGGDGDDDDDDYNSFGDGEGDGDEGKWWHRVPLHQLYDNLSVRAVLSEWCLTVEQLPGFLKLLAQMQYYSSAQWVRYLTVQERPNMFRTIERSLARFPDARSGFVGRMLADPAFIQKTALEGGIASAIAALHELHVRGKRITKELDYALINVVCIGAAGAVCSALVAPSKTPSAPNTRFPWQRMLNSLPNNAFEKSTPARSFAVPQRVSGFVAKGVELSAVNAIAAGVSASLQHCAFAARQPRDKRHKPVTPIPGISRAAGGMGVYGGVAQNCRLQGAAGLERVLLEYAKVSTTWQVIGLATTFRAVTQLALENPWGWGPRAVTACSRPAMQGAPVHHVKTKRVRRVVRRKAAQPQAQPAAAAQQEAAALQQQAGSASLMPAPA